MANRPPRDLIDYLDDDTLDEDETPFIPVRPDSTPDVSYRFFCGLFAGIAGGALPTLAPWLAGLMIFAGYGVAGHALRGTRSRIARALGLGFNVVALAGSAMAVGGVLFPRTTWDVVSAIADRHILFLSVATLAWPIGFLKYIYGRLAH